MNLVIDTTSYPAIESDYYEVETTKTNICLHHTAGGSLSGAIETLRKVDKIMVHFIVDKDGSIYQMVPTKYWSFHMGIPNTGGSVDKKTFGVEIVNFGGLKLDGDTFYSWPKDFGTVFCSTEDVDKFYDNGEAWRGFRYWAAFTNEQYASVARLCGYLCYNFNIPTDILPNVNEYNLDAVRKFSGIFTHTSVRHDKIDVGAAWNWDLFSQNLKTAEEAYRENNITGLTI